MGHRFVVLVAVVAIALGLLFASAGFFLPPGSAAIPASLAFSMIGGLAFSVATTLKDQELRIQRLERRE
jgi:hypothetical protein